MANRRQFISRTAVLAASSLVPTSLVAQSTKENLTERIFPNRLKKGDTIGLIAPGFYAKPEILQKTIETLEKWGLKTFHTQNVLQPHGYFSGTDQQRADDVNLMFSKPEIKGILCLRGGYGCTRILNMIDYQNIVKNPKPLIGFSDVTALLQAIFKETGLVGFHGPVGSTLEDRYSVKNLKKILFKPYDIYPLHNAKLNKELSDVETYKPYTLTPGKISGILVGGNLTLINAMIGTQHAFEFKNRLVFIEDIEEAPYRIDRMLTQLIDATDFTEAKAIIFGVCKGCDKEKSATQFTLKEVLKERIAPLGIPAAYGLSFGHVAQNMTLPFGVKAEFDALKRTLTLLESPVV